MGLLSKISTKAKDFDSLLLLAEQQRVMYWCEFGEMFTKKDLIETEGAVYKKCSAEEKTYVDLALPGHLLPEEYVDLFYYIKICLQSQPGLKDFKDLEIRRKKDGKYDVAMSGMYKELVRSGSDKQKKEIGTVFALCGE